MFKKHVINTFKTQWFKLILIALIIILSSFLYILMGTSMHSLYKGSTPYLEDYNQEDFSIEIMPFLTLEEYMTHQASCVIQTGLLSDIYDDDLACYEAIMASRLQALTNELDEVTLEVRYYKDSTIKQGDARHHVRFLKDSNVINRTFLVEGVMPESGDEIAVLENYAIANDLTIGDTIVIDEISYEIVGYVLFPDYTLPVLENLFVFDSNTQTLALVSDQTFDQLPLDINQVIGGTFADEAFTLNTLYETFDFVSYTVLTESNIRSGAIYTELRGGQLTSVFLSSIIAIIGIIIILILIAKSIEKERYAIGIFKALGVKKSEILMPYLIFISVYILIALLIGFIVGILLTEDFIQLFLTFYLLPTPALVINTLDIIFALILPFILIMTLAYFRLNKIIKKDAITLLSLELKSTKPNRFKWMKKTFSKLPILIRLQVSLLLRQPMKIMAFSIGLLFAFFLMFMSLSMREVIDLTTTSYYNQTDYDYIVSCEETSTCDDLDGDQAIMMPALVDEVQITLIGLNPTATLHPLMNQSNEPITSLLSEGIILSKSFKDMYDYEVGDTITIVIMQESITLEVVAISNVMIGPYVFIERAYLSNELFDIESYYNQLYTNDISDIDARHVSSVDDILAQLENTNELMRITFTLLFIVSLVVAFIVIYLLTSLSVEDEFYAISLLKVLGYNQQEISQIILNGYMKLAALMFVVTIPYSLIAFHLLKTIMIDLFNYYIPLQITFLDMIYSLLFSIIIFIVSTIASKRKIQARSLQESLKIYQI
jgi:putative ABC transport system permease protein